MKAMLFAAGLGTRLRPLTNDRPKALVEIQGKPLLDIAIEKLVGAGCNLIVVNVHHFASQIVQRINSRNWGASIIVSDESDLLLDTGGGLKRAAPYFAQSTEHFVLYNVDVLTSLDLAKLHRHHVQSRALVTLAVSERKTSRYFLFDESMSLKGWTNATTEERKLCPNQQLESMKKLAFSGVAVASPDIFQFMPIDEEVFSITEVYLNACCHQQVKGYLHDAAKWLDAGKPAALELAQTMQPWWETQFE